MTSTLVRYTANDITVEMAQNNPNAPRYVFDSDESYDAYRLLADPIIEELTDKFVAHLEATDAEKQVAYRANIKTYGNTPAPKGRDMWGAIQHTYHNGSGVRIVSCSGHGGVLVSIPQEMKIDEPLRRGQYYEEDCDMMIVLAYNPRIAVKYNSSYFTDDIRQARRICAQAVVRYYPDAVRKIVN